MWHYRNIRIYRYEYLLETLSWALCANPKLLSSIVRK